MIEFKKQDIPVSAEQVSNPEGKILTSEQVHKLSEEMSEYARGLLERIQEIYNIMEHPTADEMPKQTRRNLQAELDDLKEQLLLQTMAEEMEEDGVEVIETTIS